MTYYLKIVYIFIGLVISSSILFANMEEPPSSNVSEVGDVKVESSIDNIIKLIKNGKYEESKSLLLQRIESIENDEQAYNLLGYTERQLQNFSSAINRSSSLYIYGIFGNGSARKCYIAQRLSRFIMFVWVLRIYRSK